MQQFTPSVREGILATAVLSEEACVTRVAPLQVWRCTNVTDDHHGDPLSVRVIHGVTRLRLIPHIGAAPVEPVVEATVHGPAWAPHDDRPFDISPPTLRFVRAGFDAVSSDLRRVLWGMPEGAGMEISHDAADDVWLRCFVSDRIVGMLATVADVFRAYHVDRHMLVGSRGFSDEVEPLVQSRIPCVTKSFPELSANLVTDIRASLIRRGTLSFGWGALAMDMGGVSMLIDPPAPAKRKLGQPVRRVE